MNSVLIEIRSGEGGDDAKLLTGELLKVYMRAAQRRRL